MRPGPFHFASMATYHCKISAMTRSKGHSAVGLADYMGVARKKGVSDLVGALEVVGSPIPSPAAFAAHLDGQETRCNSQVGRHLILALPAELDDAQRARLVRGFALHLRDTYDLPSLTAVHRPPKECPQNHHAHMLLGTRRLKDGTKAREWTDLRTIYAVRQAWAERVNAALAKAGHTARVDARRKVAVATEAGRIAAPRRGTLSAKAVHALRSGKGPVAETLRKTHEQHTSTCRDIAAANDALANARAGRAVGSNSGPVETSLRAGVRAIRGRKALTEWANAGRGGQDAGRARKSYGPRRR